MRRFTVAVARHVRTRATTDLQAKVMTALAVSAAICSLAGAQLLGLLVLGGGLLGVDERSAPLLQLVERRFARDVAC